MHGCILQSQETYKRNIIFNVCLYVYLTKIGISFYIVGLVNGFLCCSMRHRHNSFSSSASSPNLELNRYGDPRRCKIAGQESGSEQQPLRKYFINSNIASEKDTRTVEEQLASYNWPLERVMVPLKTCQN